MKVYEISYSKSISFRDAINLIPITSRVTGTRLIYIDSNGICRDMIFTLDKYEILEEEWLDFTNWSELK